MDIQSNLAMGGAYDEFYKSKAHNGLYIKSLHDYAHAFQVKDAKKRAEEANKMNPIVQQSSTQLAPQAVSIRHQKNSSTILSNNHRYEARPINRYTPDAFV